MSWCSLKFQILSTAKMIYIYIYIHKRTQWLLVYIMYNNVCVYIYIYLSIYLSIYPSIYPSPIYTHIYIYIDLFLRDHVLFMFDLILHALCGNLICFVSMCAIHIPRIIEYASKSSCIGYCVCITLYTLRTNTIIKPPTSTVSHYLPVIKHGLAPCGRLPKSHSGHLKINWSSTDVGFKSETMGVSYSVFVF